MRDYIIDHTGRKKAVVLDIEEFSKIMEHVEEMEDALELKNAIEQGGEFVELRAFLERMKQEGRI
jgi:Phd_YefM.